MNAELKLRIKAHSFEAFPAAAAAAGQQQQAGWTCAQTLSPAARCSHSKPPGLKVQFGEGSSRSHWLHTRAHFPSRCSIIYLNQWSSWNRFPSTPSQQNGLSDAGKFKLTSTAPKIFSSAAILIHSQQSQFCSVTFMGDKFSKWTFSRFSANLRTKTWTLREIYF